MISIEYVGYYAEHLSNSLALYEAINILFNVQMTHHDIAKVNRTRHKKEIYEMHKQVQDKLYSVSHLTEKVNNNVSVKNKFFIIIN